MIKLKNYPSRGFKTCILQWQKWRWVKITSFIVSLVSRDRRAMKILMSEPGQFWDYTGRFMLTCHAQPLDLLCPTKTNVNYCHLNFIGWQMRFSQLTTQWLTDRRSKYHLNKNSSLKHRKEYFISPKSLTYFLHTFYFYARPAFILYFVLK